MLVFVFVFTFAACKDNDSNVDPAGDGTSQDGGNTVAGETTTEGGTPATDDTNVTEDTTTEGDTSVTEDTSAEGTTVEGVTDAPAAVVFPIGGSKQQVIEFYNKYGNAMKAYKGKVTVTKKSGTTSTVTKITGGKVVEALALKMLPNDYQDRPTYTFTNGKSDRDNRTLSSWLPRDYSPKMSEISPTGSNGVQSATCVASGNGCKITIVMNDDSVAGADALSAKPKYVSKCMDTLNLSAKDLEPFVLENANVNYTGCKIEAVFNAEGLLTKLDVTTPANITGKLKYKALGINADVVGTYKGNYTFKY